MSASPPTHLRGLEAAAAPHRPATGNGSHEGEEITHPGILANLRGNLKVTPRATIWWRARRACRWSSRTRPFVVLRVAAEGDRLVATLNDLSREPLDPETLSFDAGEFPTAG